MTTKYRSQEVLTHFRCSRCDGKWSIAGAPRDRSFFCPWCGWSNHRDEERIIEAARKGEARERARRAILRETGICGHCRFFAQGTCQNRKSERYEEWFPGEEAEKDAPGCGLFDDPLIEAPQAMPSSDNRNTGSYP